MEARGAKNILKPNVVMIVGRNAEIDPNAQLDAKYMTPAA